MKKHSFSRFMVLWTGQLISGLGNGMTAFALGIFVFRETQNATSFALIVLSLYLPSILLRPIGGVLADRFDRRLMIVIGETGSAVGVIFILFNIMSGLPQPGEFWKLYLGVAFSSAFTVLQNPAYKASVTDLLDEEQFSQGGGMVQLASSAQHLVSPILAGVLMQTGNITAILKIDISTFCIAILAALAIRKNNETTGSDGNPSKKHKGTFFDDLLEGWNAVTADKGVLLVVVLLSLITFFIGFVQTLFGPMMLSFTDAGTLGTVQSVSAAGMLLTSLVLGVVRIPLKQRVQLCLGLVMAGVSLFLLGLSTNLVFITGSFFLFFCTLPVINTSAEVLIRRKIPNDKQGRGWGIIGLLSQTGYLAAYSISGYLADSIFNPLFEEGGRIAPWIEKIIGTGPGRGIALIFVLLGVCVVTISGAAFRLKPLRAMDEEESKPVSQKGVTDHVEN